MVDRKLRTLKKAIRRQLEYYFSDKNWAKDEHLRSIADAAGFVPIAELASFERLAALSSDAGVIRGSVTTSDVVEVSACGAFLRRRSGDQAAPAVPAPVASPPVAAAAPRSAVVPTPAAAAPPTTTAATVPTAAPEAERADAAATGVAEDTAEASLEARGPNGRGAEKEPKVYVGGIPWACTEATLRKDFSECGKIVDLKMLVDAETGRSRGSAFITFADEASVTAALKYDGDDYGGRTLRVQRAEDQKERKGKKGEKGEKGKGKGKGASKGGKANANPSRASVIVKQLPAEATEADLKATFATCGFNGVRQDCATRAPALQLRQKATAPRT
eukprot:TRINITY_DN3484_c0_g2_i2.p1 TRINITY_DN3484_c0_g2~~TRINITY_DN3484_c0_g2_i2.p1  ORF type:complete len:332 (-),score=94.86 TRINITY_DN3484_c0_g2_i2:199-1194(-)